MDAKWQEKLEKDEDEFANYSKGKYFADKDFFEGKFCASDLMAKDFYPNKFQIVDYKFNQEFF